MRVYRAQIHSAHVSTFPNASRLTQRMRKVRTLSTQRVTFRGLASRMQGARLACQAWRALAVCFDRFGLPFPVLPPYTVASHAPSEGAADIGLIVNERSVLRLEAFA